MRTLKEYREAVRELAQEAIREAGLERIDYVSETVDQSDWIIYTIHALAVMVHTDSDEAIFEEMGDEALAGSDCTADVYVKIAYWAMRADVLAEIDRIESE